MFKIYCCHETHLHLKMSKSLPVSVAWEDDFRLAPKPYSNVRTVSCKFYTYRTKESSLSKCFSGTLVETWGSQVTAKQAVSPKIDKTPAKYREKIGLQMLLCGPGFQLRGRCYLITFLTFGMVEACDLLNCYAPKKIFLVIHEAVGLHTQVGREWLLHEMKVAQLSRLDSDLPLPLSLF